LGSRLAAGHINVTSKPYNVGLETSRVSFDGSYFKMNAFQLLLFSGVTLRHSGRQERYP
ncbi:hypothetical protein BgiMline_030266, partial [Biomphalaria glabrata]